MKIKLKSLLLLLLLIFTLSLAVNGKTSFDITYDYGVASVKEQQIVNPNPESATENAGIKLESPKCEGFEFVGWYLENDYITQVDSLTVTADTVLYAKWYEMSYSIDYVLTTQNIPISASDVVNPNPYIRTASEEIILSQPEYISDKYTFGGWYTDESYTEKIETIKSDTCKDITLYARWVNSQFNIFYELGEVSNSVYVTENPNVQIYTYGEKTLILPAKTNDPAYSFENWYFDEFFTQKAEYIDAETSGDVTLYANWNKTVYNITYILNNDCDIDIADIENPNDATRTADTDFVLSEPVTSDKSYVFAGWYTSPDFASYSRISKISSGINKNVTLYAKWEQAVYKISYDYAMIDTYQCPVTNTNPTKYLYGDVIELASLSVDGFIFNGWYSDANFNTPITHITSDMYGNITLYADFTEKTYTITYVLADKEVTENQVGNTNLNIRTTTERFYFDDPETINIDYSFGGWYFDAQFTQKASYISAYTTGNITVYAKWIKKVSYIPEWGDASLSEQLSAADARLILRHSAGLETFSDLQKKISDINNDSLVTAADARIALRVSAQIEDIESVIKKYSLPDIKVVEGEIVFIENTK